MPLPPPERMPLPEPQPLVRLLPKNQHIKFFLWAVYIVLKVFITVFEMLIEHFPFESVRFVMVISWV